MSDYKYFIYVDRGDGEYELSAWYYEWEEKKVRKETSFMVNKGYKVKVKTRYEGQKIEA